MGKWNPPEQVIHTRGETVLPAKGKHVLKHGEGHCRQVTHEGFLLVILALFQRFLKGLILENCLQNLNGVTFF